MIRALLSHNPVLIFSKILSPMFIDQSSKNTEKPASIKSVAMALEKAKSTEELYKRLRFYFDPGIFA